MSADGDAPPTAALPPVAYPDEPAGYDAGSASYDAEEVVARDERTTQLLDASATTDTGRTGRATRGAGGAANALGRAGEAIRRQAERAVDRFGAAPVEVRVAMVGAAVVVLAFLTLPYGGDDRTAAAVGGRLWWRPFAAVLATVLLATTLRARRGTPEGTGGTTDRLLAALVIATVGATEAGLVGLFSGDAGRTRIGYYVILAGLVTVLAATVRAARRRCGP